MIQQCDRNGGHHGEGGRMQRGLELGRVCHGERRGMLLSSPPCSRASAVCGSPIWATVITELVDDPNDSLLAVRTHELWKYEI